MILRDLGNRCEWSVGSDCGYDVFRVGSTEWQRQLHSGRGGAGCSGEVGGALLEPELLSYCYLVIGSSSGSSSSGSRGCEGAAPHHRIEGSTVVIHSSSGSVSYLQRCIVREGLRSTLQARVRRRLLALAVAAATALLVATTTTAAI